MNKKAIHKPPGKHLKLGWLGKCQCCCLVGVGVYTSDAGKHFLVTHEDMFSGGTCNGSNTRPVMIVRPGRRSVTTDYL